MKLLSIETREPISADEFVESVYLPAQAIQHDTDLLLSAILLTGFTFDIFDDAFAVSWFITSHSSLHEDEDEPKVSLSPDLNLCHGR